MLYKLEIINYWIHSILIPKVETKTISNCGNPKVFMVKKPELSKSPPLLDPSEPVDSTSLFTPPPGHGTASGESVSTEDEGRVTARLLPPAWLSRAHRSVTPLDSPHGVWGAPGRRGRGGGVPGEPKDHLQRPKLSPHLHIWLLLQLDVWWGWYAF